MWNLMTDGSFSTPTILVKTICESDILNNIFSVSSNVVIASVQIKAGLSCLSTYFSSLTRKKKKKSYPRGERGRN